MAARSILIVEDSAADRAITRRALSEGGAYRTRMVASVAAALEAIEAEAPDCILLDYVLPDGTGLDLIDALRTPDGSLPHPVVMFTGEGSETVAVRAMKAGVVDYAVKGRVSAEGLARAIENAIEKAGLQRELARRIEELEQLAYVVSHDLRSPLRTVHQNAELLSRAAGGSLGDAARRHLESVLAGTRRMEQLIVELADYCRIGHKPLLAVVELAPLVEQVISDLESEIRESDAEIKVDALPAVWGDALRLRQLFQNLVGNALEFRGSGAARVAILARREGLGWRITVRDNGIGIDAQHFERIFAPFQRLASASRAPGTGIGLAICRKIALQHGGPIAVESTPGVGSEFSLLLPGAETQPKEEEI